MVGRTVGKYRVVEQIGRGGMGTVYKAVDETLDRTVAIKVLNADLLDPDAVERFRREAMTLARLNHPRIGAIHELTRDEHDLLMVMEFISGETFEKLIERTAPVPVADAVKLCAQVLEGLQYAHNAGVVHRDLKPANVIVTSAGDVKIMDFGIARVQGSEHLTSVGFMVGTPAYMSPEQVRGEEVDPRMDLYSIAVVLYRLLTHRLPFSGDTAIAMIHSQLNNPPTPPRQFRADLPEWVVATLTRGLAKSPANRFQTATEFRAALEGGLTGRMATPAILGPSAAETMPPVMTPPSMRIPIAAPPSGSLRQPSTSQQPIPPAGAAAPATGGPAAGSSVHPQPPPAAANTVTLRAPHLATAGVLVILLVAGIGVLAFVALRRPTVTAPAPSPAPVAATPVAAEPPPGTPAVAPPASAPAPLPTPPPAAAPSTTVVAAPRSAPAATAPPTTAGPSGSSSGTNAPSTAPSSGRSGAPTPAASGAPRPAESSARGRASGAAAPTTAAASPGAPTAASLPAEHFADIRTLVVDGSRSREVDAMLSLESDSLVVRTRSDGTVLRTLSYRAISAATYVRARRPRGQRLPGALDVPDNFGGSGFLGGARHWLTLQTAGEFLVVRLEDENMIRIINAVEARTGLKVLRSQE